MSPIALNKPMESTQQTCNPTTALEDIACGKDWSTQFEYEDFIRIGPDYGNIGRFYWYNQSIVNWESLSKWGTGIKEGESIIPGSCALINNLGDWFAWIIDN